VKSVRQDRATSRRSPSVSPFTWRTNFAWSGISDAVESRIRTVGSRRSSRELARLTKQTAAPSVAMAGGYEVTGTKLWTSYARVAFRDHARADLACRDRYPGWA